MRKRLMKNVVPLLLAASIGLAAFVFLYPRLFPESAITMEIPKDEISSTAIGFVEGLGYTLERYHLSVRLEQDSDQIQYLNRSFGPRRAVSLMSDSLPAIYWDLRWSADTETNIQFGTADEREADQILEQLYGNIRLTLDIKGRPIQFSVRQDENEEEEAGQVAVKEEEDRRAAEALANRLHAAYEGEWSFVDFEERSTKRGIAHRYRWRRTGTIAGEGISFEVLVHAGRIQSFQQNYAVPKPFEYAKDSGDWGQIAVFVLFFVLFILLVVYFVQRLRADLMDLKSGLIPAALVLVGWLVRFLSEASMGVGEPIWALMLGFLVTAPFIAGGIWALFSVGESLTREVWAEKLITLDHLRRKILFPDFGKALLRGLALASVAIGVFTAAEYAGVAVLGGYFTVGDQPLRFWTHNWPSLLALGQGVLNSLYIVITFCLFILVILRRRIQSMAAVLPITILLWCFVDFSLPDLMPFGLRMVINGLIGALFIAFYLKYDFITIVSGGIALPLIFYAVASLHARQGFFTIQGFILLGILLAWLVIAVLALRGKIPEGELTTYVPDYLQRIYEKERIKRELEIARNVQITFLPRITPEIKGLEIASLCLPAREVGGDYYDFIEISPTELGVVIGDVSGKGISAAFYMTLTKGFLKSQARTVHSPKDVLINMNELFYENAERGMFVSMIYSIFNLKTKTLTFARAGHNPLIFHRSPKGIAQELDAGGIALGLEMGVLFSQAIEEKTIRFDHGDVFLFYTDGLNEAQNTHHEEFGEQRLMDAVVDEDAFSSMELLDRITHKIQRFTADAPQHDDMTAVIVKIS